MKTKTRRMNRALGGRAGFTLLEVMIAVAVFSVGMMAVAALELIALNGYASARDQARSAELSQRVVSIMKVEALNWGVGVSDDVSALKPLYTDASSPFGPNAILRDVASDPWVWKTLTNEPVDEMLEEGVGTHGRYCIYARGGYMAQALGVQTDTNDDVTSSPMIQVQVAVVAPGPTNTLIGLNACNNLTGLPGCSASLDAMLSPAGDQNALESCGMRVVHAAALIRRTGERI